MAEVLYEVNAQLSVRNLQDERQRKVIMSIKS